MTLVAEALPDDPETLKAMLIAERIRSDRLRERERGGARAKALGGDRRSKRIEACHEAVLAALGPDRDATIEEVRQARRWGRSAHYCARLQL